MTDKEKQLLLKDLCARLPFDVMGSEIYDNKVWGMPELLISIDMETGRVSCSDSLPYSVERFRPYLRPMSSMTKEEKKDYDKLFTIHSDGDIYCENWEWSDFMNSHHFDYRGLIPKDLAIEAPEGMYK